MAREHVGECRPWPQQFREKKALCGLAAAAIVSVSKDIVEVAPSEVGGPSKDPASSDVSRILGAYPYGAILGTISFTFYHSTSFTFQFRLIRFTIRVTLCSICFLNLGNCP